MLSIQTINNYNLSFAHQSTIEVIRKIIDKKMAMLYVSDAPTMFINDNNDNQNIIVSGKRINILHENQIYMVDICTLISHYSSSSILSKYTGIDTIVEPTNIIYILYAVSFNNYMSNRIIIDGDDDVISVAPNKQNIGNYHIPFYTEIKVVSYGEYTTQYDKLNKSLLMLFNIKEDDK